MGISLRAPFLQIKRIIELKKKRIYYTRKRSFIKIDVITGYLFRKTFNKRRYQLEV
jgi:hypothetical protein